MPRISKRRRTTGTDATVTTAEDNQTQNNDISMRFQPSKEDELTSYFKNLQKVWEDEKLCDVTFRIQNQTFRAHRVVLAASNSFLGAMMLTNMQESSASVIEISSDTDPRLFRLILNYIYGMTISVPSSLISPLLVLASCYSMPSLRDHLADYLKTTLSISNCCSLYVLADSHNCHELRTSALDMIFEFFGPVSKTEQFLELPQGHLEFILANDRIVDCDELLVFEAAISWLSRHISMDHTHSPRLSSSSSSSSSQSAKHDIAQNVLKLVRFPMINSCDLSDIVKPNPFMLKTEQLAYLLEAFEYHALKGAGREITPSGRTQPRKRSCAFTTYTVLEGHTDSVSALVCFHDTLITGSWDSTIKVWEKKKPRSSPISENVSYYIDEPLSRVQSPAVEGGLSRTSSSNGESPESWQCIKTLDAHEGAIRSLCVCNNMIISCSDDGRINIWNPQTWTRETSLDAHDEATNAIIEIILEDSNDRHSGTGENETGNEYVESSNVPYLVSAGDDGKIRVWNTKTWTCEISLHNSLESIPNHGRNPAATRVGVLSLAVWKNYLFSGGDDTIVRIWSTKTWACISLLQAHEDEVWALRVLPDGTLITGSVDATIRVWHCKQSDTSQDGSTISNAVSAKRRQDQIENVDLQINQSNYTKENLRWHCQQIILSDGPVYSLSYLDSRIISAGASKRISVWSLTAKSNTVGTLRENEHVISWTLLKHFDTLDEGVWSLTVHRDHLISGGCEGAVLIWS